MDLLVAWILFPGVLLAMATGCGLLVGRLADPALPRALLPLAGLALVIVVGGFLTLSDTTAELTAPVAVALTVGGLVLGWRTLSRPGGWVLVTAAATFAVYAAPIVLSGEATFAGYIRLDDTATWLALTDRVLEHGRDLDGLAPSSYEATLAFNLADGYPVGIFMPLGAGAAIVGQDVAWLIQPYMAFLGATLALALWSLARPVIERKWLLALVAFLAAQSALLFGYYLWGGVKEVAAAALIAATAALLADAVARELAIRSLVALAVVCAALVGVLSAGGILWLAPALALAAAVAATRLGPAAVVARAGLLVVLVGALSIPVLAAGGVLPPTSSPLTDAGASGNLLGPLEPAQAAGIWPAGDFRLDPVQPALAYCLVAVAVAGAACGVALAWRERAWGVLAYASSALGAGLLIYALGSPWVDGKALASASPAIPLAAGMAAAWLVGSGRGPEGAALLALIGGGILWSNVLAYRDVNLAPRDQLVELERIGERYAGAGPALMTEYQPYGVRHFLRGLDPEGASELRRREVPLTTGDTLDKGRSADTDALDPGALRPYPTLVLRRSPAQSRPPAAYRLAWRGVHYEVWRRPGAEPPAGERIPLGDGAQPIGRPDCGDVFALARAAGPGDRLVAAARPPARVVPLSRTRYPGSWSTPGASAFPTPSGAGRIEALLGVGHPGSYQVWLGGSVRPGVELWLDDELIGRVRHQLQNRDQYTRLGAAHLGPGRHELAIELGGVDLGPGSGGSASPVGPLVLSRAEAGDARLVELEPTRAQRLCGRAWDWIELRSAT